MSVVSSGEQTSRPKLKRSLGLSMATALVIGNMVGSGVFGLPSALASVGPISLLAWVITGAGAILLALVFANLGRAYPQTGGPYVYARRAFGDFAGFWTAWGYWIAAWAGNAAIAVIFVSYATVFWPSLGTNNVLAFAVGLTLIWALTLVNVAGVRESGVISLVTTVLKFVPVLLIGLIGLFYMHSGNFSPVRPASRQPGGALARDLVRGHAHVVGVHRTRVGDRAGRGGQGSRAHAAARDHVRHRGNHPALHPRHRVDHGRDPGIDAGQLERAVRGRGPADLRIIGAGHVPGQDRRGRRHDLHPRRTQRLDPDSGPSASGRSPGRVVPEGVRPGQRHPQDPGRRPRRLVGAAERTDGHELPVVAVEHVRQDHRPGNDHHAGALRLLGGRAADADVQGSGAVQRPAPGARRDNRSAGLRLLLLDGVRRG